MTSPTTENRRLLMRTDPEPVEVVNPGGRASLVLTCEHAGTAIPAELKTLGISEEDGTRHIGWDIGAAGLAKKLAGNLDATLILQRYSRLVIDCNRPYRAVDLIPSMSDGTHIPGNALISEYHKRQRYEEIHAPYHACIRRQIDLNGPKALVSVHSFTPRFAGVERDMHVGLLFNRDGRLARYLGQAISRLAPGTNVALNAPYAVEDGSDMTIPHHGEARGLPSVLLEIRNNCIDSEQAQATWAELIARALEEALCAIE